MPTKNENPLISVVIPTTRFDDYLKEAVTSALEDGWDNTEVLVVLDGPPEPAPDWLGDPRVRLLSTGSRSGSSAAINVGVMAATGEFIARLDSDDVSLPGRFHKQVNTLLGDPSLPLVSGLASVIGGDGVELRSVLGTPTDDDRRSLLRRNPYIHSAIMMPRSYLSRVGYYDERCKRMQDYDLILRLATLGPMPTLNSTVVQYRVHQQQNNTEISGFYPLMLQLYRRKRALARSLDEVFLPIAIHHLIYAAAQFARYKGWRKPRYLSKGS